MKNILASYYMRNVSASFQHLSVLTFQKIIFYVPIIVLNQKSRNLRDTLNHIF